MGIGGVKGGNVISYGVPHDPVGVTIGSLLHDSNTVKEAKMRQKTNPNLRL
jgi:hypothetical protein